MIIQKRISTFVLACFLMQSLHVIAGGKATVAFIPFSKSGKLEKYAEEQLYSSVTTSFINAQRFQIMEKSLIQVASDWSNYLKNEQFINSQIAKQGEMKGAKIIIVGFLSSVNATRDDKGTFSAYLTFELKYVNVETGIADFALSVSTDDVPAMLGIDLNKAKSEQEAISKAIKGSLSKVERWIKEKFPLERPIFDFEEDDKNKTYRIVVDGGTDVGFKKTSQRLYLVEKECKANSENKTLCRYLSSSIIELKVERVENETAVTVIRDKSKWLAFKALWDKMPEKERNKKFLIVESVGK